MSDPRPLGHDPLTGITTKWHGDIHTGEQYHIEKTQDVTDLVEATKAEMNSFDERARWSQDLNKVASIPLVVYWELKRQGIVDDPARFKAWLNHPDNRVFRTRPGKV